jgi:hypothetical protein
MVTIPDLFILFKKHELYIFFLFYNSINQKQNQKNDR